jgi:hypothetical protein
MRTKRAARSAEKDPARWAPIYCPECQHSWDVDFAKDGTSDKTCPACGHHWSPELSDYSRAIKRGGAPTGRHSQATRKQSAGRPLIDIAAVFAARNKGLRTNRASALDPGAVYRERNARGGK